MNSRTVPVPQLPDSNSNSSEELNSSSHLTNSLTHQLTNQLLTKWLSAVRLRVTLRLAVYGQSVFLGAKALETHDQYFLFFNWTLTDNPYTKSSLTRGWVCRLQLLLAFASAVILGSQSLGTHDHMLLSQTRDSPTWSVRSLYLYTPGTRWPSYTPRHWVPFPSPSTSRRATMEVLPHTWLSQLTATVNRSYCNISARTAQKTHFLICCLRVAA
jgi:hypothetical protein